MKIIFWDYDGTLVDTEILYKKSIESFFQKQSLLLKEISDDYFFKNISGKHPEEFLSKLKADNFIKPNFNLNPEELRKYYFTYFNNLKNGEIKVTQDIDSLINKFSNINDIIMCITSSSFRRDFIVKSNNVNNQILNKYFDVDKNVYLCGAIDGCKFKPEPDIFIYAFNDIKNKYKLNINKKDCIFIIEDSIAGCQAGRAFKKLYNRIIDIIVIGYLGGNKIDNYNNLIKNGADFIAKDTNRLFEIIS